MTELKEKFPKSGHVTEVCKEWLVREDGALAYHLQSQEINEYYRGNKFRNAVVRQDFPTALNEQIKEKEDAERQAALYHQMINEQEQADEKVARKLSEKLEKDSEVERVRQLKDNENAARRLQNIYVETRSQVKNEFPLPPRQPNPKYRAFDPLPPLHYNPSQDEISPLNSPHIIHTPENSIIHEMQVGSSSKYTSSNQPLFDKRIEIRDEFCDVADSIRKYDLSPVNQRPNNCSVDRKDISPHDGLKQYKHSFDEDLKRNNGNLQKLSPEKYDYLMGNLSISNDISGPIDNIRIANNNVSPVLDDDTERIVTLQQLGLPTEEIQEIDRKLKQEKRDEELARLLQEQEKIESLTQEERDRLLAIEAQDKELARMLQEREKAKAKRAKEKARLKKQQQRVAGEGEANIPLPPNMPPEVGSPVDVNFDRDSYSNPIDLIPQHKLRYSTNYDREILEDESYATPKDKILPRNTEYRNIDAVQHSFGREDEIYTLPVDNEYKNRPNSLDLKNNSHSSSRARGSNYVDNAENIATMIDPTYSSTGSSPLSPKMCISPPDKSPSPVPPYMPIQGTRRNASLEGKKKKSKDKCTHQ